MDIYVGNLPLDVTEEELRLLFVVFGEVLSVKLMNDKYIGSGQPRVYGYVQMALKSEGQAAVKDLQEKNLRGQVLQVIEALPLSVISTNKPLKRKNVRHLYPKIRQR